MMPRPLIVLAVLAAASLTACAIFRPVGIPVDSLSENDARLLAVQIADLAARQMPPGAAIQLADPPATPAGALINAGLQKRLGEGGFTFTGNDPQEPNPHRLEFRLNAYRDGLILRVTADGAEVAAMFSRGASGELVASSPLSMRQAPDD